METLKRYFCCGLISLGTVYSYGEFESLKQRSPFGDAAPKPVEKPVEKKPLTPQKPPEPPKPKKPELDLGSVGYVSINNKKYFSVRNNDKASKETFYEIIPLGGQSPSKIKAVKFNDKNKQLDLEVKGFNYTLKVGEGIKENPSSTANTSRNSPNNAYSGYGIQGNYQRNSPESQAYSNAYSDYDYDFDFDDWDFDDDDDWDY